MVFSILFLSITNSRVYAAEETWAYDKDVALTTTVSYYSVSNTKYNISGSGKVTVPFSFTDNIALNYEVSPALTGFVNGATYDFELTLENLSGDHESSGKFTVSSESFNYPSNLYVWVTKNGSENVCLGKYEVGKTYVYSSVAINDNMKFYLWLSSSSDSLTITRVPYSASGSMTTYAFSREESFGYLSYLTGHLKYKLHVDKTVQEEIRDEIKKGNELQKEQNETSKGILGKITEFFASFFENLKGLFVPEDGYFSDFFTRLNDFFSEKLGMLYAPIDMFITFLNTIKDASSTDSGITFPELAWDGTVIIPETKFSFDTIYKDFPDLKEKIYFVTDVILVGAVLWLLQIKLKEVLEN